MALSLRLRSGDVVPEPELPFDAPRVVVGRAPGCDLQLPDPSVSPRHASLRQRGSDYVLVDEGSENGTFAGDTRLVRHAPHTLKSGDLLRFGRVWVEVRLGPAEHPTELQASRELARRLVDAALAADERPFGMNVASPGSERSLCLVEPRRPYVVGSKKGADLKLADVPSRCLELRRQADQLWVTLQVGASARLAERELVVGERTAWPRSAVLTIGEVRLMVTDPTAQTLEQLERGPTERLADDVVIDPPRGSEDGSEDADEEEADDGASDEADAPDLDGEADALDLDGEADAPNAAGASRDVEGATIARTARAKSRWSRLDAIVFFLAVGVLALSLWAIRWLAQLGSA
jgi:pSer/pThr/pTyr-binding forkhead associated (FHA) protein